MVRSRISLAYTLYADCSASWSVGAHGFGYRCFGFVGIFFDEIDDLGEGGDHPLDEVGRSRSIL